MSWTKENLLLVIIAILVLGGFYWYSWRPSSIISDCSLSSLDRAYEFEGSDREDYEYFFTRCIREKGIIDTARRKWKLD